MQYLGEGREIGTGPEAREHHCQRAGKTLMLRDGQQHPTPHWASSTRLVIVCGLSLDVLHFSKWSKLKKEETLGRLNTW